MSEFQHADNVTVEAFWPDCIEGECEHRADDGAPIGDGCPSVMVRVCVDCMEEMGAGRTEEEWSEREVGLMPWPHPGCPGWTETPGGNGAGYVEERIFRDNPEHTDGSTT